MQNHDRRSHAGSPPPTAPSRKGWQRPDVPRPVALILPSPGAVVPDLDPPEPLTALDHFLMLPCEARQDIARGTL